MATLGVWFFLPGISFANAEIEAHSKTLIASIAQEPRTLNTLTAESVSYTAQVLAHTNEGLLRYDGKRRLTGGVAQRWEVAADHLIFWLREDAAWENGAPVTAQDFSYKKVPFVEMTLGWATGHNGQMQTFRRHSF